MNEQWNTALEQVEDEFLLEAASYRQTRQWPRIAVAAAAVLVLAVGWSILRPDPTPAGPMTPVGNAPGDPNRGSPADGPMAAGPDADPGDGFGDWLKGDSSPSEEVPTFGGIGQEPPVTDTLHFSSYEDLQTACLGRQEWFLHPDLPMPCSEGQPLNIEDITVFEKEMYNEPWVWYFLSHEPHVTVRIPTTPSLTANMDPDTTGAEALRQIWPDAPNLHNREEFANRYTDIREVQITTSEGFKTALRRQEADRDRVYLTFLQNGSLVTVAGPENALEGNWLESFSLVPIDQR